MKRTVLLIIVLAVAALAGCTLLPDIDEGTLTLDVPESGYPPFEATITADGVFGGTYTFDVGGETRTGPSNTLTVTIDSLPCDVTVTWVGKEGIPQTVTDTIYLLNNGPVIGQPLIRRAIGMTIDGESKQFFVPETKYLITFPDAHDNEGGDATLVGLTVFTPHWDGGRFNTTFCPPYEGIDPPEPAEWRVEIGYGQKIDNACFFFSMWDSPLLEGYDLPWCPMSWGMSRYPMTRRECDNYWPDSAVPQGTTEITATFEDEMGARTTESFTYPTTAYIPCDERQLEGE